MADISINFQTVLIVALLFISLELLFLILLTARTLLDSPGPNAAIEFSKLFPSRKKKKEQKDPNGIIEEEVSPGNKSIIDNMNSHTSDSKIQEIDL